MAIVQKGENRIIDPVCGMTIRGRSSALHASYQGNDYYFCSDKCKAIFEEDPSAVCAMQVARTESVEDEKAESLERLADELAHDIRNPLTAIGGFARRVYESLPSDDPGRNYLEIVIENVTRLENLIEKLVDLKTLESLNIGLSNPNQLVSEALNSVEKEIAEKNIDVRLELNSIPQLNLDKDKMRAALIAIIKNAVEAMDKPPKLLRIATRVMDDYVEIEVSDTGRGILKDQITNIFTPFYTTKIYGPGIGLTFARRVIQAHKGTISASNALERGAIFLVRLPVK